MEAWAENNLGNLFREEDKSPIQVQHASGFGEFPFFTSGDSVLKHDAALINGKNIFLATGGKANIKFYEGEASYSTDTYVINSENVDTKFLYYLLLSKIEFINNSLFTGSGLKHLQKKDLKKTKVKIPTEKTEQERIALILSEVDDSISKTEILIAKYQRIKTGLMQDLLTNGIDAKGYIRSKVTHKFILKNGFVVPDEWEVMNLEELTRSIITYGIVQAGPDIPEGIPYIRTGDMSGDFLEIKNLLRTSQEIALKFTRSQVEENDIVFALRATIGKVLIVPKELHGANLTQGTARIAPNWDIVTTSFLLWTMQMFYFKNQILKLQKGTTFSEITLGELRKMRIMLPRSIVEQERIITFLQEQENVIQNYKANLSKLFALKTGLMQDLLTSKIRVK